MNTFFIIAVVCSITAAQEHYLNCIYAVIGDSYSCALTINNPNGLDDFTEIGGTHLEGFSNADVRILNRAFGVAVSTNVPSIICDTFPNLSTIRLQLLGLTEIGDNAFGGCSRIYLLSLNSNQIRSISANALVNLHEIGYINLSDNFLTLLDQNIFASQQNLTFLDLGANRFEDIPTGLFRPLGNLEMLYLNNINLNAINSQWFINNSNLRRLILHSNNLIQLPSDLFDNLENLNYLDIGGNPIELTDGETFRGLVNLVQLNIDFCRLSHVPANLLEHVPNLLSISLTVNQIEELPEGFFVPTPNITYINLFSNRLKVLRRNSFGSLSHLDTLDLDLNIVNALDREIIDDAISLNTIYFTRNLCASSIFVNFQINKVQYLPVLERCFSNFGYIVDTITQGNNQYSFFEGPPTGIALRVNSSNEVQIALTPFSFVWNPTIEILIGTANNTRSVIRMNQETNVVTVPTPNILMHGQWNDFRVTWMEQVILVYTGNNILPFMAFLSC